jgi:uncharacterized membrane protein HdeD (DUF308 family)
METRKDERTVRLPDADGMEERRAPWWLFLVTGVLWLVAAVVILRFDRTSLAAVGILLGVVLGLAAATEVVAAMSAPGWRWAHWILAVLFAVGSIWAFVHPIGAFWELASILGFLLVLKGSFDIIGSAVSKSVNELWWLGLIAGIFEILLGFWASQQMFAPRAALIIIWVGFSAILRGITEIVMAFSLRKAEKATA